MRWMKWAWHSHPWEAWMQNLQEVWHNMPKQLFIISRTCAFLKRKNCWFSLKSITQFLEFPSDSIDPNNYLVVASLGCFLHKQWRRKHCGMAPFNVFSMSAANALRNQYQLQMVATSWEQWHFPIYTYISGNHVIHFSHLANIWIW